MNILRININDSGRVVDFDQDFKIMRGSYKDILINVEVPHSLLLSEVRDVDNNQDITGNSVRVAGLITTATGQKLRTQKFEFTRIKDFEKNGEMYRIYQRLMPKEFTLWETRGTRESASIGSLKMAFNIINFVLRDGTNQVETIVASPEFNIDVYPSDFVDGETEIEVDDFNRLLSQVQNIDRRVDQLEEPLYASDINLNSVPDMVSTDVQSAIEELNRRTDSQHVDTVTGEDDYLIDNTDTYNPVIKHDISKIDKTSIANDLTTNDADKVLAASQGVALKALVEDEAETRAQADSTLQDNIDAEAGTRELADAGLQGQIDALETNKMSTTVAETTFVKKNAENQTITGNLGINGDLNISGTTTTLDTQTLNVIDNIIVTNSNGEQIVGLSGIAIRKNATETYGIVYNPTDDSVQLGIGILSENGTFTFNENEGEPVATRIDSSQLSDGQVFIWDATNKRLVGSNDFVKFTDYATGNSAGVIKTATLYGTYMQDDRIRLYCAYPEEIDKKETNYQPITPRYLDYATMKALTDPKQHTWTAEQQTAARTTLDAVGKSDYATNTKAGVIRANSTYGTVMVGTDFLGIQRATEANVNDRDNGTDIMRYRPLTPSLLDYSVMSSLTNPLTHTWTDEQKALARETLGVAEGVAGVSSVNNKTGDVQLSASDVGALPDSTAIPTSLSELSQDNTHRLVTDAEKTTWNNKLSSYIETDPTVPSHVKSISEADITNWSNKANVDDIPTNYVTTNSSQTVSGNKTFSSLAKFTGGLNANVITAGDTDYHNGNYVTPITIKSAYGNWYIQVYSGEGVGDEGQYTNIGYAISDSMTGKKHLEFDKFGSRFGNIDQSTSIYGSKVYVNGSELIKLESNSYGYYLRFFDGTQICYGSIGRSSNGAGAETITFPQAFTSTPYVSSGWVSNVSSTTSFYGFVIPGTLSTTGCQVRTYKDSTAMYIAIGRWK